jgi:hypothetical protein
VLLDGERHRFLQDEWPRVTATIKRLGLSLSDLVQQADSTAKNTSGAAS